MCVSRIFLPRGDCVLLLLGRKPGHPERRGGTTKIRVEEFQGEVSIEEGSGQKDVPFSSHYYRSLFRNREREDVQKSTSRVIVSRWRGEKKKEERKKSERLMDQKLSIFRPFEQRDRWWNRFHPRLDFDESAEHYTKHYVNPDKFSKRSIGYRWSFNESKRSDGSDPAR